MSESNARTINRIAIFTGVAVSSLLLFNSSSRAEQSYEGLWIGRAALSYVTEVTVPLDEDNIPIAPDPNVPTKTHDEAYIRLLLHVNGAGQVNLLKDVAILTQNADGGSGSVTSSESDYVLVTDERLYSEFPEQEGVRLASAVFDFGDNNATEAVDTLVEIVALEIAESVFEEGLTALSSDSDLRAAESTAENAATTAAAPEMQAMDVAGSFIGFLNDELPPSEVTALATADQATYILKMAELNSIAVPLMTNTFYNDSRAVMLLADLDAAINPLTNDAVNTAVAHNLVSRYADVDNSYQRFITGRSFGDMIESAAQTAGEASILSNATVSSIQTSVDEVLDVRDARDEALEIKDDDYADTAPTNAVEVVLNAIINRAFSSTSTVASIASEEAEVAGLNALENDVPRYALQTQAPTADYNTFVQSTSFDAADNTAAHAAALAAVKEAKNDQFHTVDSLYRAAKIAAVDALRTVYAEAARARQTELPMEGTFVLGGGDSRLLATISSTNAPLGSAALTTTVHLPASHPTNPFRHRRHPDHTVGFDIQRNIRIDFDGESTNQLDRISTGIDQISGTYREEVFGLHKPLGPSPDSQPIGLKVEGKFELNRISHIDTLNSL